MESEVNCYDINQKKWTTLVYEDVNVFGQKLKQLRRSKKLSIKEFSQKIGWWYWCVQDWENGEPVSVETLNKIAGFYNVSPEYLLSKETSQHEQLSLF